MDRSLRWRTLGLLAIVALCVLSLLPTVLGKKQLPPWYGKFFSSEIQLGLDLQGGLHIEYSIDLDKAVDDKASEIKRDIEWTLTRNEASSVGDASSVRKLGSVETWLATNFTNKSSGTATYVTAGYNSSTGNTVASIHKTHLGSFSENDLKAVISACWTQGGQPDMILVGPNCKKRISTFTGIADITKEAGTTAKQTRIIGGADVYVSDFGEHRVVPSRFSRDSVVLVLDMDFWALAQLRGMTKEKLAKTGDSEKWQLLTELTLESRQEAASGKIDGVDATI